MWSVVVYIFLRDAYPKKLYLNSKGLNRISTQIAISNHFSQEKMQKNIIFHLLYLFRSVGILNANGKWSGNNKDFKKRRSE